MSNKTLEAKSQLKGHISIKDRIIGKTFKVNNQKYSKHMKTQPNQSQKRNSHQISNIDYDQQSNGNYRQLSRIIYNHLQKKIQHQEHLYQRMNKDHSDVDQSSTDRSNVLPQIRGITANQRKRSHTENVRNQDMVRPMKRLKYILKSHQKNNLVKSRQKKGTNTSIDAYFDLSCLNAVKKRQFGAKYRRIFGYQQQ